NQRIQAPTLQIPIQDPKPIRNQKKKERNSDSDKNKHTNSIAASILTLGRLVGGGDDEDGSGDKEEEQKRLKAEELRLVSTISQEIINIFSWDEFVDRSVQLFKADPESTRYVVKYRHCDGKLVLKVTDNKECLKFKTDQAQEARKMEKLNNIFFTFMARGPDVDLSEVNGKEQMETQPVKKGRGRKQ
ncbi:hypothetical protein HID58_022764, partial [Brassica napus]